MLERLIPRDARFYDLFDEVAARVVEGAGLLQEMLRAADDFKGWFERIKAVEHAADLVTHESHRRMHRTFVTPLDREDMHRLATRTDDVLDRIEETSAKLWLYDVRSVPEQAHRLAAILLDAARELQQALRGLRDLKHPEALKQSCIRIKGLESDADVVFREAIAHLFREEGDMRLVLMWKEIYESLEAAIDRSEDVANIIEGVVLEHA